MTPGEPVARKRPKSEKEPDVEIVREFPPNYGDILAAIPAVADCKPIFAWGGIIYNPYGIAVDAHLQAHEGVHGSQHALAGSPQAWWARYLTDAEFRVEQEVEAYRRQLESFKSQSRDRERRHRYAMLCAAHLSSPMYGGLMTQMQAFRRITA